MNLFFRFFPGILTAIAVCSCTLKPDLDAVKAQLSPYKKPTVTGVSPSALFVGGNTAFTVTGENLDVGVTVEIGGKPCVVQSYQSGQSVTCTAPANSPGSYTVIVSTPDAKTATTGVTYDKYAFSQLSLVVGKLFPTVDETDGYYNQGSCLASLHLAEHNGKLLAAEINGNRLREIDLNLLFSTSLSPTSATLAVETTDPNPPYSPTPLSEVISGFYCFTKSGDTAFICPTYGTIMSIDLNNVSGTAKLLAGYTTTVPDPFADAYAYPASDPRGYGKINHAIKNVYHRGNDLIVVLTQDIIKISNFNSVSPSMTVIVGDDVDYQFLDGNNVSARFYDIQKSVLIGDNLFVIDGSLTYFMIRKIDLSDPNYPVTTVLGDVTNMSPPYGEFAPDGTGTAAYLNSPDAIAVHDGNILIFDEFDSNHITRLRLFDPDTQTISTISTVNTHAMDQYVMGSLSTKAKLKNYAIAAIYYIENWGLAISTNWGLLRLH